MGAVHRLRSQGRGHYDRDATASQRVRAQREILLQPGPALLRERFPEACAVADVLGATGIGRNTFYSHFRDITAWRDAVVRRCFRQVNAAIPRVATENAPPATALSDFVAGWFEVLPEVRPELQLLALLCPQDLQRAGEPSLKRLHALGARMGLFAATLAPEALTAATAALIALTLDERSGPNGPRSALVADVLLRLLR